MRPFLCTKNCHSVKRKTFLSSGNCFSAKICISLPIRNLKSMLIRTFLSVCKEFFEEDYSPLVHFLLPLPPDWSYSVRRTYLKIKRCAFFVYGNLRNFHCMQKQHSGLHVYVRGAAVYLHTKVSQDLHR